LNKDRLDNRLSSHRSTYAKFELICVINFTNSSTVHLFEQVIKLSLGLYCLGKSSDTRLEQYSFKDDNINIMDLILNQFNIMNIELQGLGNICPKEKIDEYNRKVLHNLQ